MSNDQKKTPSRLEAIGAIPTAEQEAAQREMEAGLRALLDDITHAATSALLCYSNPEIISKSAPLNSSPLWVGAALQSIYAEIDRRFPVPRETP